MGPADLSMIVAAATAAVLLSIGTMVLWRPVERTRMLRWPLRGLLLAGGQVAAVLTAALVLNHAYDFYVSWPEVFGQHPAAVQRASTAGRMDAALRPVLARDYATGHGGVVRLAIPGLRSTVRTTAGYVYLPPQYGDPAYAGRSFPVVELLPGFAGGPKTWLNSLHVSALLDEQIAAGSMVPMIAVMPNQNVAIPRDTECVNVVGGPHVETYLTADVRAAVVRSFRASPDNWTIMGFSTGGYCATNLAMRNPAMFRAVVSIAGYNAPARDRTTGNLFGTHRHLWLENSPEWRAKNLPDPNIPVLLVSTRQDLGAYYENRRMATVAKAPMRVWLLTLPRGGHNAPTFMAEVPAGLSWLSHFVSAPLAPIPSIDGLLPYPAYPATGTVQAAKQASRRA